MFRRVANATGGRSLNLGGQSVLIIVRQSAPLSVSSLQHNIFTTLNNVRTVNGNKTKVVSTDVFYDMTKSYPFTVTLRF